MGGTMMLLMRKALNNLIIAYGVIVHHVSANMADIWHKWQRWHISATQ